MTTAQVVETSVTVNNNSPIQDYIHPDNHTQPVCTYKMTPWVQTFHSIMRDDGKIFLFVNLGR